MKPIDFLGDKVIYDKEYLKVIDSKKDIAHYTPIARILFEYDKPIQRNLGEWIADAINQKLERERMNDWLAKTKPLEGTELDVLNETLKKQASSTPTSLLRTSPNAEPI